MYSEVMVSGSAGAVVFDGAVVDGGSAGVGDKRDEIYLGLSTALLL